jgi:hypothetical protein
MAAKYTKWPQKIPNGHKVYQIGIKYTNNFHPKTKSAKFYSSVYEEKQPPLRFFSNKGRFFNVGTY